MWVFWGGDSDICIDGKHMYPSLERYGIMGCVCCEHLSVVRPRHVDGCYLVAVVVFSPTGVTSHISRVVLKVCLVAACVYMCIQAAL